MEKPKMRRIKFEVVIDIIETDKSLDALLGSLSEEFELEKPEELISTHWEEITKSQLEDVDLSRLSNNDLSVTTAAVDLDFRCAPEDRFVQNDMYLIQEEWKRRSGT